RGGQGEKPALLYILFVLCSSAQCVCHCPHTRLRLNASRTEVVFITTQIVDDFPVGQNFNHAGCQTRDKLAVMRNKEQSAFVKVECVLQGLDGFHVQVVGRFIEQHDVVSAEHQPAKAHPVF